MSHAKFRADALKTVDACIRNKEHTYIQTNRQTDDTQTNMFGFFHIHQIDQLTV